MSCYDDFLDDDDACTNFQQFRKYLSTLQPLYHQRSPEWVLDFRLAIVGFKNQMEENHDRLDHWMAHKGKKLLLVLCKKAASFQNPPAAMLEFPNEILAKGTFDPDLYKQALRHCDAFLGEHFPHFVHEMARHHPNDFFGLLSSRLSRLARPSLPINPNPYGSAKEEELNFREYLKNQHLARMALGSSSDEETNEDILDGHLEALNDKDPDPSSSKVDRSRLAG